MRFTAAVALFALPLLAAAQRGGKISVRSSGLVACEPSLVSWSPTTGPYTVTAVFGTGELSESATSSTTSATLTFDEADIGRSVLVVVSDAAGKVGHSRWTTVEGGACGGSPTRPKPRPRPSASPKPGKPGKPGKPHHGHHGHGRPHHGHGGRRGD